MIGLAVVDSPCAELTLPDSSGNDLFSLQPVGIQSLKFVTRHEESNNEVSGALTDHFFTGPLKCENKLEHHHHS